MRCASKAQAPTHSRNAPSNFEPHFLDLQSPRPSMGAASKRPGIRSLLEEIQLHQFQPLSISHEKIWKKSPPNLLKFQNFGPMAAMAAPPTFRECHGLGLGLQARGLRYRLQRLQAPRLLLQQLQQQRQTLRVPLRLQQHLRKCHGTCDVLNPWDGLLLFI